MTGNCNVVAPVLSDFTVHLGESFRVKLDSHELVLELTEATRRCPPDWAPAPDRREPFSLLFFDPLGSPSGYLPQATYQFEHETLGITEWFIVPIGPRHDGAGMQYEVIFT